jgi:hypothetical protein
MMLRWFKALALGLAVTMLALLLLAACADDGPPPTPGGGGGEPPGRTVVPNPPPLPTATDVSGDWARLESPRWFPGAPFSLRYPAAWTVDTGPPPNGSVYSSSIVLTSWDPAKYREPEPPPGGVKVDIYVIKLPAQCEPRGTTAARLGGEPAFYATVLRREAGGLERAHIVQAERAGFLYCISGLFMHPAQDQSIFAAILGSFTFEN